MKAKFCASILLLFILIGCESTDVVDSGTYTGEIVEVEPSKTEIYVETEDGKTLELYFGVNGGTPSILAHGNLSPGDRAPPDCTPGFRLHILLAGQKEKT